MHLYIIRKVFSSVISSIFHLQSYTTTKNLYEKCLSILMTMPNNKESHTLFNVQWIHGSVFICHTYLMITKAFLIIVYHRNALLIISSILSIVKRFTSSLNFQAFNDTVFFRNKNHFNYLLHTFIWIELHSYVIFCIQRLKNGISMDQTSNT